MSIHKSFLAPVALVSLLAAPALALDLSTDIKLGMAPEDMTTIKPVDGSAFVGNEVRTKDQMVIGQVESVYESDAGPVALVTLNAEFGAKSSVKSFTVPLGADTTADGALTLGWTESELIAQVSGQIDPTADHSKDGTTPGTDDTSGGDSTGESGN